MVFLPVIEPRHVVGTVAPSLEWAELNAFANPLVTGTQAMVWPAHVAGLASAIKLSKLDTDEKTGAWNCELDHLLEMQSCAQALRVRRHTRVPVWFHKPNATVVRGYISVIATERGTGALLMRRVHAAPHCLHNPSRGFNVHAARSHRVFM